MSSNNSEIQQKLSGAVKQQFEKAGHRENTAAPQKSLRGLEFF
jgi:hypothetical protein